MDEGFWKGYVVVSKENPSFRMSEIFDFKQPAIKKNEEMEGTKVIKVCIYPKDWKGEKRA